jgi:hypothetical protein
MLATLKSFLVRRREHELERLTEEYTAMTPAERREVEAIRSRGPAGEREMRIERAAGRTEEAQEARAPEYLDPPGKDSGSGAA